MLYEIPTIEDITLNDAMEESRDFENQIDKWDQLA